MFSVARMVYTAPSCAVLVHSGEVRCMRPSTEVLLQLGSPRRLCMRLRVLRSTHGMRRCSSRGLHRSSGRGSSVRASALQAQQDTTNLERSAVCSSSHDARNAVDDGGGGHGQAMIASGAASA